MEDKIKSFAISTIAREHSNWTVDIEMDTFNGVMRFLVRGNSSDTVRWLAKLVTVEVGG